MNEHRHVNEHEDDLETVSVGKASGDAARIADAIALGLEHIAKVIEGGFRDLADARHGRSTRKRPGAIARE